jgi:hypothetical protein
MFRESASHDAPRSLAALALMILAACADGTGPGHGAAVRAQLIRLPGAAAAAATGPARVPASSSSSWAWSSALNIASFRIPIRGIVLNRDTGSAPTNDAGSSATVYECPAASNDGCLVDLAGPALQDLLGAAATSIHAGTYTEIDIMTCGPGDSLYHAYLSGTVSLGGRTWTTRTAGVLDTTGAAQPVTLDYHGCGRRYTLPTPLVIGDTLGAAVAIKLYFDIRDLAWASLGTSETAAGWLPGGCAGPRPDALASPVPFLCTGYPDVAAVLDDAVPVIERYRINNAATIGLIFRASGGEFVGGFTRRYFEEGTAANPGFNADTPVQDLIDHGDGTYLLASYGGGGPGGVAVAHYLTMPSFRRANHSGTATAWSGVPFSYAATRIE